jgi:uncharacterized HAD superfamily protein
MNLLELNGYGIKVKVNNLKNRSELIIFNGKDKHNSKIETYTFTPRKIPYDTIIIDGHSGYISLQALHWLSKNNIPVFVLDFDGQLL